MIDPCISDGGSIDNDVPASRKRIAARSPDENNIRLRW
jgi:hypothetical protein